MAAKKKLKPAIWQGFTLLEMRAVKLLLDAFGPHYATTEEAHHWKPLPWEAKFVKCPDCATYFKAESWKECRWCGRANEEKGRWT